jgi:hypothetical protein
MDTLSWLIIILIVLYIFGVSPGISCRHTKNIDTCMVALFDNKEFFKGYKK